MEVVKTWVVKSSQGVMFTLHEVYLVASGEYFLRSQNGLQPLSKEIAEDLINPPATANNA